MNFLTPSQREEVDFPFEEKRSFFRKANLFGLAFLVGACVISTALYVNKPNLQAKGDLIVSAESVPMVYGNPNPNPERKVSEGSLQYTHAPSISGYNSLWSSKLHSGHSKYEGGLASSVGCNNVYLRVKNADGTLKNGIKMSEEDNKLISNDRFPGDGYLPDGYVEFDGSDGIEIAERQLMDCNSLKVVLFRAQIKSIGKEAFRGCRQLLQVIYNPMDLPPYPAVDYNQVVGEGAFHGCWRMVQGGLPSGVEIAEKQVFYGCNVTDGRYMNIPSKLKVIKEEAFYSNSNFKRHSEKYESLTLPFVNVIEARAFKNTHLNGVDFSQAPLEFIGDMAFENTEFMGIVKFPDVSTSTQSGTTQFGVESFRLAGITSIWFLGPYTDYDLAFNSGSNYEIDGKKKHTFTYNRIDCLDKNAASPFCACVFGTKQQAYAVYYQGQIHAKWCNFDNVANNQADDPQSDDKLPVTTPPLEDA